MAQENREVLVNTIKDVHERLRRSFQKTHDLNKVWQEHLENVELRREYSLAMKKLATEVWGKNECRIEWSYKTCIDYFHNGGLEQALLKEKKQKLSLYNNNPETRILMNLSPSKQCENKSRKIKLLDVGSCYNPFSKYSEISSVAVDLTPATKDVFQCDFLNLKILSKYSVEENNPGFTSYEESFDVVILSLVLEYLPACEQRMIFYFKTWQLLRNNGLCIIITPDSKSLNYNAPMIKSWKLALEKMGFKRFKYQKLTHLHCMAFRKSNLSPVIDLETCMSFSHLLYIPQDFKTYSEETLSNERTEEENENVWQQFMELPNENLFI